MFEGLARLLKREKDILPMPPIELPDFYNPRLHYNCLIETFAAKDRNAAYQELRRDGKIRVSHILPDGRLQLSLTLKAGLDAINAVTDDKLAAFGLTKVRLFELMVKNPDMEFTVLQKTNNPKVSHAVKIRIRDIVAASEDAFYRGVEYRKRKQYRKAIECYDEAIRAEPEDIRAWNNKVEALAREGKLKDALSVAEEMTGRFPGIGFLWESKGRVLAEMRRVVEAGKCMEKACQLDKDIAKKHEGQIDQKADKRLQELMKECRKKGGDPEKDADFWIDKFAEYLNSSKSQDALICLQMAATVGPDHYIMYDGHNMVLIPPEGFSMAKDLLPKDCTLTRLEEFAQDVISGKVGKK